MNFTKTILEGIKHWAENKFAKVEAVNAPKIEFILLSSTEGSTKQFKITIDDTGTLTVSEIVAEEVE